MKTINTFDTPPTATPGRRVVITRTLAFLALLAIPTQAARPCDPACANACGLVVKDSGYYVLPGNKSYPCVTICEDAALFTGPFALTVTGAGGLTIVSGGYLLVDGANGAVVLTGGGTHTIDGRLWLEGSRATLSITTTSGVLLTGDGHIDGQTESSDIYIAAVDAGVELTSDIKIGGILDIEGPGDFTNDGHVKANRAGTLDIVLTGTLDDTSGSDRWEVDTSGAKLRFTNSISTLGPLEGEIVVSNGTFEIDKPLTNTHRLSISGGVFDVDATTTMGSEVAGKHLNFTGGEIDVATGVTFTHN